MPRTLAIGDVHGCSAALRALIAAIELQPSDTLVMLGDYVDRGPDSKGVIDFLLELRSRCRLVTLQGNHELMMLAATEDRGEDAFWQRFGGLETLESYGETFADVPETHWDFIKGCLPYFETPTHFFVHANYHPLLPLSETGEDKLFWSHLDGHAIPSPHTSGRTAIVGHTAQRSGEILDGGHVICLDTYCHGSGWLTALDVDNRQFWQANREGQLRSLEPMFLPPLVNRSEKA